jgi:hypothetical protein
MPLYKIKITADATWFAVKLESNAYWAIPTDGQLAFSSEQDSSIRVTSLNSKEMMMEAGGTGGTKCGAELCVETDESEIAVMVDAGGSLTINSDVAQQVVNSLSLERFSLRLA